MEGRRRKSLSPRPGPTAYILAAKYQAKNLAGRPAAAGPAAGHDDFAAFLNGSFVERDRGGFNFRSK
jgi:hypothetical protein